MDIEVLDKIIKEAIGELNDVPAPLDEDAPIAPRRPRVPPPNPKKDVDKKKGKESPWKDLEKESKDAFEVLDAMYKLALDKKEMLEILDRVEDRPDFADRPHVCGLAKRILEGEI